MSLPSGQKITTIVKGAAAPYGDATANSQVQDNAYDPGLWDSAGKYDDGHQAGAVGAQGVPPVDSPGGRNLRPGHTVPVGKSFSDGTDVQVA